MSEWEVVMGIVTVQVRPSASGHTSSPLQSPLWTNIESCDRVPYARAQEASKST